jgi:hypothetical protein
MIDIFALISKFDIPCSIFDIQIIHQYFNPTNPNSDAYNGGDLFKTEFLSKLKYSILIQS